MKIYVFIVLILTLSIHAEENPFALNENMQKIDQAEEVLLSSFKDIKDIKIKRASTEQILKPQLVEIQELFAPVEQDQKNEVKIRAEKIAKAKREREKAIHIKKLAREQKKLEKQKTENRKIEKQKTKKLVKKKVIKDNLNLKKQKIKSLSNGKKPQVHHKPVKNKSVQSIDNKTEFNITKELDNKKKTGDQAYLDATRAVDL